MWAGAPGKEGREIAPRPQRGATSVCRGSHGGKGLGTASLWWCTRAAERGKPQEYTVGAIGVWEPGKADRGAHSSHGLRRSTGVGRGSNGSRSFGRVACQACTWPRQRVLTREAGRPGTGGAGKGRKEANGVHGNGQGRTREGRRGACIKEARETTARKTAQDAHTMPQATKGIIVPPSPSSR